MQCICKACHNPTQTRLNSPNADTSFDSDASADYAVPPDAGSEAPRSSTRASYLESPRRTAEKALEKSGYLTKLGGKIKSWHKRYFVLKSGVISYWKSQVLNIPILWTGIYSG